IGVLTDEVPIVFTERGVYVRVLDMSHTAMVSLELPSEAFSEYKHAGEVWVGLRVKDLRKIVGRAAKGDGLAVELGDRVRIKLLGRSTRSVAFQPLEVVRDELYAPRVDHTALIKIPSGLWLTAMRDVNVISDVAKLEATDGVFVISAEGDGRGVEARLERASNYVYEFEVSQPTSARYSMRYLLDMARSGAKLSEIVTVKFATAKPLSLTYEVPGGGVLTYYLAPLVE
ncbi:MAG: DNA polymerase sliding clamp, partial [Pyrobaculum sp.]